ncbi:hypothetical protein QQ045_012050 [Rhodiola kirilowii]
MSGTYHGESSDSRNKFIHQVFLSFRGEDVRNGFVGHLFNGLRREGFRVFMDNDGLEHGRDIQIKLLEAIEQSEVSIVTLSTRYADSRWCLDELAKIMELNVSPDRFVLPVFFDMEPTDVRHQTGLYNTYFEAHVKRFEGEMGRVDNWRWALKEVAALKGPSLKDANRNEAHLIQNIIKEVRKMLPIQKLALPPNIIGVDSVVRDICNWLQDGSQDVGVGVYKLNEEESTKLFSLLVFDQTLPLEGYEEVSYRFVRYSGGLPLALCILGPLLRGEEDIEIWEDKLQTLEKYPNQRIQVVLKLSFDSLENEDERNLFLHMAVFFVGRGKEYAFKILKACGVYTKAGFQNLANRCLVSFSGKKLMMHQLIQEMGREIVRQESITNPGLRSRLWDHKETLDMLQKNKGTTSVKGLMLAFPAPKSVTFKENHIQPVSSGIGLASILSPTSSRRVASNLESIQTDAFTKLENLNLLQLSYVQLKGGYADFPKEIKWLLWRGCPLESLPEDLELYEMAVLDMQSCRIVN